MEQREIKFRQANFVKGKIEWHYWGFIDDGFISPMVGDVVHNEGILFKSQQYTGLKDKNGKEIYEGDIVKSIEHNYSIEIKWFLNISNLKDNSSGYSIGSDDIVEVIGNIYQNELEQIKK